MCVYVCLCVCVREDACVCDCLCTCTCVYVHVSGYIWVGGWVDVSVCTCRIFFDRIQGLLS